MTSLFRPQALAHRHATHASQDADGVHPSIARGVAAAATGAGLCLVLLLLWLNRWPLQEGAVTSILFQWLWGHVLGSGA